MLKSITWKKCEIEKKKNYGKEICAGGRLKMHLQNEKKKVHNCNVHFSAYNKRR